MAKTNSGLVNYVKAQHGKPYWFGTFGQTASAALYNQKKKQYPAYYTAKDFPKQYGKRVHDCAGLPKGYLWSATPTSTPVYNAKQDVGSNTMYNQAKEKGKISTFKKIPGQLVFKANALGVKSHVGVYIGNNKVEEAKGHAYGVVTSSITSGWTHWAQHKDIQKDNAPAPAPAPAPTPKPTATKYKVTAKSGLRVRKGPGLTYGVVKVLKYGTVVTVYEQKNGWGRIGTNQWCSMTYLKKV